jgi:molecular chaperone DnaK (HSP70)
MAVAAETSINSHKCLDGWGTPYADADIYCRMCGEALINLRVEPDELLLLFGDAPITDVVKLRLNNTASVRTVHLSLRSAHPAIEFSPLRNQQVEIDVPAGRVSELELRVNISKMGDAIDGVHGAVDIRVLGTSLPPLKIPIRIGPAPVFECSVQPFAKLQPGTRSRTLAHLRQTAGLPTELQEVAFDPPAFSQAGLLPGQCFEKGKEITFQVGIDSNQVVQYGTQVGKLILKFDAGSPHVVSIPVEVEEPPKLNISQSGQIQIPQGVISDVSLFLRNQGGGVLQIESLEIPRSSEWFRLTFMELSGDDGLKQVTPLKFPLLIPSSKRITITCQVDAEGLPEGPFEVEIIATLKGMQPQRYLLRLQVDKAGAYQHFVAIDFGTTSSCVSYWDEDAQTVQMVSFVDPDGKEEAIVPSVAFYDREKKRWLAGFDAVKAASDYGRPELIVRSIKRSLNEGKGEVWHTREVEVEEQKFAPEDVAREIFRYLKRQTERHLSKVNPNARLKCNLDDVMITLPANFTDTGVQAVLQAAREAGLIPFQIDNADRWHEFRMDEPSAAAIDAAACVGDESESEKLILIFDFGGGTLDVSVLRVTLRRDLRQIKVLAHKGKNWLGGDDFTAALMKLIADQFRMKTGKQICFDIEALKRSPAWDRMDDYDRKEIRRNFRLLWETSDSAKISLTSAKSVAIHIEPEVAGQRHYFETIITVEEFEQCIQGFVGEALRVLDLAVKRAAVELTYIDEVIATGKTSLIPLVRKRLAEHCNKKNGLDSYEGFDVKLCVARGACRYAYDNLEKGGAVGVATLECVGLHEFTNSSYGIDSQAGLGMATKHIFKMLIPEGTRFGNENDRTIVFKDNTSIQVSKLGKADITIYQHAGDPKQNEEISAADRDIVPIDQIRIRDVRVKDRRNPPPVEVSMRIGKDGLLEAEAQVLGHDQIFLPENRYRI